MEHQLGFRNVQGNGESSTLSLQSFTFKTVMLFALTRPCRSADLAALDLSTRAYCPEGVVFTPIHLSKQSRPSHCNVVFFPSFREDKHLCPVEALKAYEAKTKVKIFTRIRVTANYFDPSMENISWFAPVPLLDG